MGRYGDFYFRGKGEGSNKNVLAMAMTILFVVKEILVPISVFRILSQVPPGNLCTQQHLKAHRYSE